MMHIIFDNPKNCTVNGENVLWIGIIFEWRTSVALVIEKATNMVNKIEVSSLKVNNIRDF